MTAVYYICIMVVLILIATVVPRYLYERQRPSEGTEHDDDSHDIPIDSPSRCNLSQTQTGRVSVRRFQRQNSGYDFVNGSRMYYFLRQRYMREGWTFRFNLIKQFALWKSFEVLAYNVCQYRSGYLYKNPSEMQRIFNLSFRASHNVNFSQFNTLCTRNMLATITKFHYSAFMILVMLIMLTGLLHDTSIYLYMGMAATLCVMNVVIMIKTLRILKGIVKDRLRIYTMDDIEHMLPPSSTALQSPLRNMQRKRPSFKVVAQLVRATVRMQMSVLCHRQLHYHDSRFWFRSPSFLLRLFQFATTGQAFYLVWLTLVVAHDHLVQPWMYFFMAAFPVMSLLVVTPLTMPSLVLVMSLTGYFVEQNPATSHDFATDTNMHLLTAKDRIRVARRSYLRSTDDCSDVMAPSPMISPANSSTNNPPGPEMLLHMYDAFVPSPVPSPLPSPKPRRPSSLAGIFASPATTPGGARVVGGFFGNSTPLSTDYTKMQEDAESATWSTGLAPQTTLQAIHKPQHHHTMKMFEKYCSSYGGYPSASKVDDQGRPDDRTIREV
ncbi:hypothetical protein, variant [Aphanomyces invadans]|nr:hypothetical protein, variant [Aphanomyces invadans]ETV99657.1 hypothetical protein, variant [Aphanomyces invadans]|eukprot:XP_008871433.1 hypothetical protein, variant [Aphanomyces invadans]